MGFEDFTFCNNCGAKVKSGARFCVQCGKALENASKGGVCPNAMGNEKVLLSAQNIRRLAGTIYQSGELELTAEELRFIRKGMFLNSTKSILRIPVSTISRAFAAKNDGNTEWKLQVVHSGIEEAFVFPEFIYKAVKVWALAISDRFSKECYLYDHDFYLQFINPDFAKALLQEDELENGFSEGSNGQSQYTDEGESEECEENVKINGKIIGNIAKTMLTSGFSPHGIRKGIKKATNNLMKSKTGDIGLKNPSEKWYYDNPEYCEGDGISELYDEIGEIYRDLIGKETEHPKMEALIGAIDRTFPKEVSIARERALRKYNRVNNIITEHKHIEQQISEQPNKLEGHEPQISFENQIALVEKMKSLVDAGILTQEEFEKKKKDIMNL